MDFISLDSICTELEFGYANLEAVDMAMCEGSSMVSPDSLYITRRYLGDKLKTLREAINSGVQEEQRNVKH